MAATREGYGVRERLLIGSQEANKKPLPPKAELTWCISFTSRPSAAMQATK
ncbi:MAG: Epoxide hydrolase (EC [uncultured Paraburkholderia sp.]|nr:MAG: Epoxide hydrolase (EC [uncultured Paraburkholderia sp.]